MNPVISVGDTVMCWPQNIAAIWMPDGGNTLECPAIVCGVWPTEIAVHYFLPSGSNGACRLPIAAASKPERGRWWPRQFTIDLRKP